MNVVVMIQGREAIPVRAISLLTDWETMSPDVVAHVLAWDDEYVGFPGLQAFPVDDSQRPLPARYWENDVCRQLKALSDSIKAIEVTHETGMQDWRRRSLEILPASVFVWKDEFEPLHCRRYGPDGETVIRNSRTLPEEEHARRVALNFEPFIPDPEIQRIVMQGFESLRGNWKPLSPSRHDEIVLPAGTERVNVTDISTLIAEVLYAQQLAAGALPEGAQGLPADSSERARNVQLYRLAGEESPKVRHAIEAGALVAFSKLTKSRCGIDDIGNAYVKVDAFTAFVTQTYDGMHVRQADAQPQDTTPCTAPATDGCASGSMSWTLNKPQRFQGYRKPLYDLLKAAQIAGQPIPKARDVLDKWKENSPHDVATVTDNGLKYYDTKGNTKPADLDAIRKAIGRMIHKCPTTGR